MQRRFNTTGPCYPHKHYMLPPERRLAAVQDLIAQNKYFVFHAGRQTGKTTSLVWLEHHLRAEGKRVVRLDMQTAANVTDPAAAFALVLDRLARELAVPGKEVVAPGPQEIDVWLRLPGSAIVRCLQFLAAQDARPLIVLVDEADSLVGEAMRSFLLQLRDGYIARETLPFPASVALVGMRAIRDYVLTKEQERALTWLGTSSPFNIAAETHLLTSFTEPEVGELLGQHTAATGQRFEQAAIERVWFLSQGHPWLINALADEAVSKQAPDRATAVTAEHIEAAKETIIRERRTHIDSLIARLREPRIAAIVGPMLRGETTGADVLHDDIAYAIGMGLLAYRKGEYQIANPIYREVIPRALTFDRQAQIHERPARFLREDGSLDMLMLMRAWQTFWRKDGHLAADGFGFRESGPHLMLMAFLQRIINGGGRVEREYGLGRGALDLHIDRRGATHAIEVKLRRDSETEADALEQVTGYLDQCGLTEGWLVMFDLRKDLTWAEKLTIREVPFEGRLVRIVGC